MAWQAPLLYLLLHFYIVELKSAPPFNIALDSGENNLFDVTPVETKLIAPPPESKIKYQTPSLTPTPMYTISFTTEQEQPSNQETYGEHDMFETMSTNSDPSFSYGYLMNDKTFAHQVDHSGRSSSGYGWSMPDGGTTMFMSSPGSMPTSWYQWSKWSPQNIGHNSGVNVQQQINTFLETEEAGINDNDQKSKIRYRKTNSNSSSLGNVNNRLSHDKRKTVTNHNENGRKHASNYGTGNRKVTGHHNTGIRNIKSHQILGNKIKNTISNQRVVEEHSSFDSRRNVLPEYQQSTETKHEEDENVQLGSMKQDSYIMKIIGRDSQWIETADENGERVGFYSYINDEGQKIGISYTAGKDGYRVLDATGVPGLSLFG